MTRRVFVAGHRGMVGRALVRVLSADPQVEVVTADRAELDLLDQSAVDVFLRRARVDEIHLAAARVGGIHANNTRPAEFIAENLIIETNVITAAHRNDVDRLMFLGSSCIYPRDARQPMPESALLTGPLEPTNEPYAIAKIAGIKLCESYHRQYGRDYRSVMPTNLYGPGDNFDPESAHVLPALLHRFHTAAQQGTEEVVIWGSGTPRREFLHVDDMAAATVHLMNVPAEMYRAATEPMRSHVNVGTGADCTIADLAARIAEVTGYEGRIGFDRSRPDGTPRKLLDVSLLSRLGWQSRISLADGLADTYHWFLEHQQDFRGR
ncbi:GDP-L-fucose synthase [Microlunatus sp. Y2014]|uniref:GDP-L-fucose synthase n=1 Tax=Microlunatus sp. Y2014 TaxID=3418488 RepID=UPI003DA6DBA3